MTWTLEYERTWSLTTLNNCKDLILLLLHLDLSAGVCPAVEGGSASAAVLAATPKVEWKLSSERKTFGPIYHQTVGLDEDIVLQRLFDSKKIAVDTLSLGQGS